MTVLERAGSARILVVDDNLDATLTMSMLLETLGYAVATANDGPKALELAASFQPDVVLLDIGLPGMNGLEVASEIRKLVASNAVRQPAIVALTGWGRSEDLERTRDAGFVRHLVKPVHLSTLRTLLAELAPLASD